ncbi:MAG: helix-turn-helix domain-containing protein [Cyanobacteria bacterium J06627_3]
MNSKARERVLAVAQKLFVERGYEVVTVKDIARAAEIYHASLYHHFPRDLAFEATILPIFEVLETAKNIGEIDYANLDHIAGTVFSSFESLPAVPEAHLEEGCQTIADNIIEVFIKRMQS